MAYIIYILLILLLVILGDKQKGRSIIFRIAACCLFIAFVGFRKYTVGVDSESYKDLFYLIPTQNYVWLEVGFDWLIRFLNSYNCEYNALYLVCIILTAIPMFFVLEKCENYSFSAFLFYIMTLATVVNGMRQCVSVGIFMFGSLFIIRRKLIPFLLCVLFSLLFHYSSIVLLPLYFFMNRHLSGKTYVIIYAVSFIFCFVNLSSYIAPLTNFISTEGNDYSKYTESAGKSLSLFGFIYSSVTNIIIFYWIIKSKIYEKFPVLANGVIIALVIKNMTFNLAIVGRLMMYFNWFQFLVIPMAINRMRYNTSIRLFASALIIVLFFIAFLNNLVSPVMRMWPYEYSTDIFQFSMHDL